MPESHKDAEENENGESLTREALASKRVFTTGEAAVICGLSQQTIIRCFDSGRVAGFRVPGSKFRRIPRDELVGFMRRNNLPMGVFQSGPTRRAVCICPGPALEEACRGVFSLSNGYDAVIIADLFLGGVTVGSTPPDICILTFNEHNSEEGIRRIASLRALPAAGAMRVIAVGPRHHGAAAARAGADAFAHEHHDPRQLSASLSEAAASLLGTREV
jgi:excisionase family DNA binding protein